MSGQEVWAEQTHITMGGHLERRFGPPMVYFRVFISGCGLVATTGWPWLGYVTDSWILDTVALLMLRGCPVEDHAVGTTPPARPRASSTEYIPTLNTHPGSGALALQGTFVDFERHFRRFVTSPPCGCLGTDPSHPGVPPTIPTAGPCPPSGTAVSQSN